jgi:Spy/CpxP family protein refolding chaperone
MKKRFIVLTVSLVAVALLVTAPLLVADPPRQGRFQASAPAPGGPMMAGVLGQLTRLRSELNLSDTQVDELKAIASALRTQNEPLREELRGGMREITSGLVENPDSLAAAQAALSQHLAAEQALRNNVLVATSSALKVLTPEQRTRLVELQAERAAHREQRREHRGRRGR